MEPFEYKFLSKPKLKCTQKAEVIAFTCCLFSEYYLKSVVP